MRGSESCSTWTGVAISLILTPERDTIPPLSSTGWRVYRSYYWVFKEGKRNRISACAFLPASVFHIMWHVHLIIDTHSVTAPFSLSTVYNVRIMSNYFPKMAHPTILQHDFMSTAKITKKSMERLASFSKMRRSEYRLFVSSQYTDRTLL